jgi:hypothetical protein
MIPLATRESGFDVQYLTDGVHLYEVESVVQNHGTSQGLITTVRDCVGETVHELTDEQRQCRFVGGDDVAEPAESLRLRLLEAPGGRRSSG